jgi:hypothetical protein
MSFIPPEIKQLQGNAVTRQVLDSIKEFQTKEGGDWNDSSMGYLDYVTDRRNPDYIRNYIGQTLQARRRLFSQHSQSILHGDTSSIHYFIIWLGNGSRSANFIKLWEFPRGIGASDKVFDICLRNILEALFCRAFDTHHGSLTTWDSTSGLPSGYGLNIMTPLVQAKAAGDAIQGISMSRIPTSPDPQIRY